MLESAIKFGEVRSLASVGSHDAEKVSFSPIFSNANGGVVIAGFKAGQSLATHTAPAELMVYVTDGEIEFTLDGVAHTLRKGDFMLVGANVCHSVSAKADSTMMLVKVKP